MPSHWAEGSVTPLPLVVTVITVLLVLQYVYYSFDQTCHDSPNHDINVMVITS
jgi:hypothetical protein